MVKIIFIMLIRMMIIEMMTKLVIIMNGDVGSKNDDDDGVFSFHNQIR